MSTFWGVSFGREINEKILTVGISAIIEFTTKDLGSVTWVACHSEAFHPKVRGRHILERAIFPVHMLARLPLRSIPPEGPRFNPRSRQFGRILDVGLGFQSFLKERESETRSSFSLERETQKRVCLVGSLFYNHSKWCFWSSQIVQISNRPKNRV